MDTGSLPRLFFGLEVYAPWPEEFPPGRLVPPNSRHLTLAFLGNTPLKHLESIRSSFLPSLPQVGIVGIFDTPIFLPEGHPRVAAWHMKYFDRAEPIDVLHRELSQWLISHGYPVDKRPLLSHITIARKPFLPRLWRSAFVPLPFVISGLHLYESKGDLVYEPIWSFPFSPPFEPFSHTADIAFLLRGDSLAQLSCHAQVALAFEFPPIIPYLTPQKNWDSLDGVIVDLNALIARADAEVGAPFKAVSFHGEVIKDESGLLQWEMIVDV